MTRKPNPAWTPERTQRLRDLIAGGHSAKTIAAEFGCTRNMVIGKAARSGIRWPARNPVVHVPTPQQAAWQRDLPEFLALLQAGHSPSAIARALGRPVEQVRDKAQRLGVRFGHHGHRSGFGMVPKADRPRAEPIPPPAPLPAYDGKPVHFLARRSGQCVWPLWQAPDRIGMCCGGLVAGKGEPYCAEHRASAWTGLGRRYATRKVPEPVD